MQWQGRLATVAIEATTGWRWVARELEAQGFEVHLFDLGRGKCAAGSAAATEDRSPRRPLAGAAGIWQSTPLQSGPRAWCCRSLPHVAERSGPSDRLQRRIPTRQGSGTEAATSGGARSRSGVCRRGQGRIWDASGRVGLASDESSPPSFLRQAVVSTIPDRGTDRIRAEAAATESCIATAAAATDLRTRSSPRLSECTASGRTRSS
jgi:hypothetical protein